MGINVLIILFYLAIYIRLIDMGMKKSRALIRSIIFPFKVTKIHYQGYKASNNRDFKSFISQMFYPVINLSDSIVRYSNMYLIHDATIIAIKEKLNELSDEDKEILISCLVEKGIIKVVKRSTPNEEEVIDFNGWKYSNGNQNLESLNVF